MQQEQLLYPDNLSVDSITANNKKAFILDSSVIIHDPNCLFNFDNNDVLIPFVVIHEVDGLRKAPNGRGRSAREAIRLIDALREKYKKFNGLDLGNGGKLFIIGSTDKIFKEINDGKILADNIIINIAKDFISKNKNKYSSIALVSKDIGMRIKSDALGVNAENYESDRIKDLEEDSFYLGKVKDYYQDPGTLISDLYSEKNIDIPEDLNYMFQNQFVIIKGGESSSAIARRVGDKLKLVRNPEQTYGIKAKNACQQMALDLLLDEKIQLVALTGNAGTGKAQPLNANILTPDGWVKMGDIKIDDYVIGSDGKSKKVLNIFPQGMKDIYKVKFSDGSETECCKEHLWYTETYNDRSKHQNGTVKNLEEIMNSLYVRGGSHKNHSIPTVDPIEFNKKDVPVDPYLLGLLLGNGNLTTHTVYMSSSDQEIIDYINNNLEDSMKIVKCKEDNYDYRLVKNSPRNPNIINPLINALKDLLMNKYSNEKFIPEIYKYNSIDIRLNILRGLMDTDGYCSKNGKDVVFYTISKQLAEDVSFLVKSFGGKTTITIKHPKYTYNGEYRISQDCYVVLISMDPNINPFLLSRKAERYTPRTKYTPKKYIIEVEYIGKKEAKCILIDSEDHLYVTDDFILTHNTLLSLAAGLEQILKDSLYEKMVCLKPIIPVGGKDIGFLPGDKTEKLSPWLAPYFDNIAYLAKKSGKKGVDYVNDLMDQRVLELEAMTYIRGRSIPNTWIIVDELQNITKNDVKTILTRAGEGSKIIALADPSQIDTPYIDKESCGIVHLINSFKNTSIFGCVELEKSERSKLAGMAANLL